MITYPFPIRLDHMIEACGVYAAPDTTWTLPFNAENAGINRAVLSSAFGEDAGKIITVTPYLNTVLALGDYSATAGGRVILGRQYSMELELSPQLPRDDRGLPLLGMNAWVLQGFFDHSKTGDYSIIVSRPNRADLEAHFSAPDGTVANHGTTGLMIGDPASETTINITAPGPRPASLVSGMFHLTTEIQS